MKTDLDRRRLIGLALATPFVLPLRAHAQAEDFGIAAGTGEDQTNPLQQAMLDAAESGRVLTLPAGKILVDGMTLPSGLVLRGVPGHTVIASRNGAPLRLAGIEDVTIDDITFRAETAGPDGAGLIEIESATGIRFSRCRFGNSAGTGINAFDAQAAITDCVFAGFGDAAIHSMDSRGLTISGNRVSDCGNAGIRIWRGASGRDSTIITGNRIERIDWRGGGSGQNGNGVNVFRADGVIVADNHIADCAFTAVRLNGTRNTQVSGNVCLNSGEVAIFSEFAFSGSVIANNIVDGAAAGISITNLDSGGQLAVCSGNIVRNIYPRSEVNPDTSPYGIYAEAETVVTGNTVQNVPGLGFGAGFGPFLRNVAITGNVANDIAIGIGVSVVDGAGAVHVANNIISGATEHAIVGRAWNEIVEPDLLSNAARFPNVSLGQNRVVPAA